MTYVQLNADIKALKHHYRNRVVKTAFEWFNSRIVVMQANNDIYWKYATQTQWNPL